MAGRAAIITRTKNRPLLLKRAAQSVARQSHDSFTWVVVNDGGDEAEVRAVLQSCEVPQDRVLLISNPQSVGMEAASNIGIEGSDSDYILVHDDDDTLHPDFLSETVSFLESPKGQNFGGVATGVEYVSEEIRGDEVIEHDRFPFLDWVKTVEFAELMAQNTITTISFLYRRDLYHEVGGYKEDLPVLGDWYFNIEFVLRADIKVIDKALAYYHHRDHGDDAAGNQYSNSAIAGLEIHEEYAALVRNKLIRENPQNSGISAAIVMGYFAKWGGQSAARAASQNSPPQQSGGTTGKFWLEYDRLWLFSCLQSQRRRMSFLGLGRQGAASPAMPLQDLGRLAKAQKVSITPPDNFDDGAYLKNNPDVAGEVEVGGFESGYEHYVLFGHLEGRERTASF